MVKIKELKDIKKIDIKKFIGNIGIDKLLIMAACGVALIILSVPSKNKSSTTKKNVIEDKRQETDISVSNDDYCEKLEKRVEKLLSGIDGISDVKVMITLKCTTESVVLTEISYEQNNKQQTDGGGGVSEESSYKNNSVVVFEKDSNGNEIPYVIKENTPQIEGIAVIIKGGGNTENILKITNTLCALFNVDMHKISVIENKGF